MGRSLGRITIHDAQLQTANSARKIRMVPMNIKPKAELFFSCSSSPEPTAFRWLTHPSLSTADP